MKLKEEYGLDTFTLSDLVEEALKFFQDHPNPIVKQVEAAPIQEVLAEESKEEAKPENSQDQPPAAAQDGAQPEADGEKSVGEGRPKTPQLRENPLFAKSAVDLSKVNDDV